jgi:hypothetical protein
MIIVTRLDERRTTGYFIEMSPDEALRLIVSLAGQMTSNNCNSPRVEQRLDNGEYFSIGVTPRKEVS